MRRLITMSMIWLMLIGVVNPAYSQQVSRQEVLDGIESKLRTVRLMSVHPVIVRATRIQNDQGLTLDTIQERDKQWIESGDNHILKLESLHSDPGRTLRKFVEDNPDFSEAFATDNQGANVAVFPLTSDYWQGDEDKWINSFNDGDGTMFIGELEFDESSNSVAVQVSVPILDRGQTIGVLVVGITQSYLQE